ncbi:hypothetical protein [Echinococcus multilocularis]|uniref:Uncharacterized protein n=1 Tax=Echinococcus multilocularis TaxID=6211 RepID=A0A068Y3L5_ECHMU|nr:hypothetical protein [Echinococcus multilocularis]
MIQDLLLLQHLPKAKNPPTSKVYGGMESLLQFLKICSPSKRARKVIITLSLWVNVAKAKQSSPTSICPTRFDLNSRKNNQNQSSSRETVPFTQDTATPRTAARLQ